MMRTLTALRLNSAFLRRRPAAGSSLARIALAPLFMALLSSQSGCSSPSVREGIWELSFNLQRSENREPLPIPPREVRISIEYEADESSGEVKELVEIVENTGSDKENGRKKRSGVEPNPTLRPLYGEIPAVPDGRKKMLFVEHRDDDWFWRMAGVVANPELIRGTNFMARAHGFENLRAEGKWLLKWLRDE